LKLGIGKENNLEKEEAFEKVFFYCKKAPKAVG